MYNAHTEKNVLKRLEEEIIKKGSVRCGEFIRKTGPFIGLAISQLPASIS